MRKRLVRVILFFLPLLSFTVLMDTWLRNMDTMYKEKMNGIKRSKNCIQVLILGNSHADYAVDPDYFSLQTYNIANVNQSFYFDKRIALKVCRS
jgi:hypothetical protein